jgi:hypothetical protein
VTALAANGVELLSLTTAMRGSLFGHRCFPFLRGARCLVAQEHSCDFRQPSGARKPEPRFRLGARVDSVNRAFGVRPSRRCSGRRILVSANWRSDSRRRNRRFSTGPSTTTCWRRMSRTF